MYYINLLFQNLNFITTSLSYQSPLFQHNQPPPLYAINRCITMDRASYHVAILGSGQDFAIFKSN